MTIEKLIPTNGQKSFGGKAVVITTDDGWKLLKSYSTIVAGICQRGGIERYSSAKSATTSRHIVSFLKSFAGLEINPKWFYELPRSKNRHEELEEEQ